MFAERVKRKSSRVEKSTAVCLRSLAQSFMQALSSRSIKWCAFKGPLAKRVKKSVTPEAVIARKRCIEFSDHVRGAKMWVTYRDERF